MTTEEPRAATAKRGNPTRRKAPAPTGKTVWAPQAGSQEAFLSCPIYEVLYEGPRGGGKTDALLMDFAQHVGQGYGAAWKGILFRVTYPQLSDVISKSKRWFRQIWPAAKYNEAQHFWRWPTGEELYFRQFNREDDYWNFHGHEYPWIGWEELCNWASPAGYLRMMSLCRSSTPGVPAKYRATTNPFGPGLNWCKHRFRLPAHRMRLIDDATDADGRPEPQRIAIFAPRTENVALLTASPDYLDRLVASARSDAERKAWIEGSWDIVAGGMVDDVWSPKHHVVENFTIPASWKIDRAFDWGSSKPFSVGWWAESDGTDAILRDGTTRPTVRGDLFRIAEWYGWNGTPNEGVRMLATEVARGIIEREIRWELDGRVRPGPADSAIFAAENGNCIATDMIQNINVDGRKHRGIQWVPADKRPGSRKTGWEQLRTALRNSLPTAEGPREKPGLFVFRTCDQFIRTIPVLPRDERDLDDVDTDAEDHIADEVRYRIRQSVAKSGNGQTVGMY